MLQLFLTVLAIALFATTLVASISYVNPSALQAADMAKRLDNGFSDLRTGAHSYFSSAGAMPASIAALTPQYVFIPPAPNGTQWTFTAVDAASGYVCFSGTLTPPQLTALNRLKQDFSPQAYFIASACGATADQGLASGGSVQAAATLWVTSNG